MGNIVSIEVFIGAYFVWNMFVFAAMGRDKRRAKRHEWRIPEAS